MKRINLIIFAVVCLGFINGLSSENSEKKLQWDGSETVPVHIIPLKDEFEQLIIPTEKNSLPFSSRFTCAPCHDYDVIKQGLHFSGTDSGQSGRVGEPWFWLDEKTGTVLPLSYQNWKGTWHPDELGINPWNFALFFGRHMTGGGKLEPAENEMSPESRWNVSGKVEINCMGCHNASRLQNHSEWAVQILRENFRWAASGSSGLGEVGGMASRLPATWDIFDGPSLDDTEWAVVPSVRYNSSLFNSNHQVFFDITDKPKNSRCLSCHSVTPVDIPKQSFDADVHTSAGLLCVDCHRSGIEHEMIRGYEGEVSLSFEKEAKTFTCKGCHMGEEKRKSKNSSAGRLGAPFPKHRGLPAVHLKKLSCTACHSVPWPSKDLTLVRTSRANRLGIFGVAKWQTDQPQIIEPVYVRDDNGKIAPNRLVWPSFWGKIVDGEVVPLRAEEVLAFSGEAFASEENVAQVLLSLYREPELGGIPVLIAGEKIYSLNVDGGLDVSNFLEESAAETTMWAVSVEGKILPLIPEFETEAEIMDMDVEVRIQIVLEALATNDSSPGQPVLLVDDKMYLVQEGYLEKRENPEAKNPAPRLCWLVDGKPEPLIGEFDLRTIQAIGGEQQNLTEEQVKWALQILDRTQSSSESGTRIQFVFVSSGLMFLLNEKGEWTTQNHESAEPITWPMGHRVRPAQQSLGINGCKDCHRANSPFFFGKVKGIGPLITERVQVRTQSSFMKLTLPYQRLFGLSFSVRPVLKVVLFVSALVCGSILLIFLMLVLGRISGLVEKRK
ncbi:MAG: hypothetical protein MUP98_02105 [Candidatus Aminicenantes bacterium]|nr:hypothetical protein [Candidatus Aminicenantes bacterium]